MTRYRDVLELHTGHPASDGAGVRLTRVIGGPSPERFDPFLMLDQFDTQNPDDYVAGFPSHPHRGFGDRDLHARKTTRNRHSLFPSCTLSPFHPVGAFSCLLLSLCAVLLWQASQGIV